MKTEMEFRDILKDIMVDRNLNQSQVAKLVGIKASQVSEWMHGKCNPSYDMLKILCKALDISGDEILLLK